MVSLADIHRVSNVKQAPSPRPLIGGSWWHRCRWTSHHTSQYGVHCGECAMMHIYYHPMWHEHAATAPIWNAQ